MEHVGVGVGVGSDSLEKCGLDPNDVYQLSFYIFYWGSSGNLITNNVLMYDFYNPKYNVDLIMPHPQADLF